MRSKPKVFSLFMTLITLCAVMLGTSALAKTCKHCQPLEIKVSDQIKEVRYQERVLKQKKKALKEIKSKYGTPADMKAKIKQMQQQIKKGNKEWTNIYYKNNRSIKNWSPQDEAASRKIHTTERRLEKEIKLLKDKIYDHKSLTSDIAKLPGHIRHQKSLLKDYQQQLKNCIRLWCGKKGDEKPKLPVIPGHTGIPEDAPTAVAPPGTKPLTGSDAGLVRPPVEPAMANSVDRDPYCVGNMTMPPRAHPRVDKICPRYHKQYTTACCQAFKQWYAAFDERIALTKKMNVRRGGTLQECRRSCELELEGWRISSFMNNALLLSHVTKHEAELAVLLVKIRSINTGIAYSQSQLRHAIENNYTDWIPRHQKSIAEERAKLPKLQQRKQEIIAEAKIGWKVRAKLLPICKWPVMQGKLKACYDQCGRESRSEQGPTYGLASSMMYCADYSVWGRGKLDKLKPVGSPPKLKKPNIPTFSLPSR